MAAQKPNNVGQWATDPNRTLEPALGKKSVGFKGKERPPARWFNWLFNVSHQWFAWLNERMFDDPGGKPEDFTVKAVDGGAGTDVDGGGLNLSGGSATGAGASFVALKAATAGSAGTDARAPEEYIRADGANERVHGLKPVVIDTNVDDSAAITGTGKGEGAGVVGKGGALGVGVYGEATGPAGAGVSGLGAGPSPGVVGQGGATNGPGVRGLGTGTGEGVQGIGGANDGTGIRGIGNGDGHGVVGEGAGTGHGVLGMAGTEGFGVAAYGSDSRAALQLYQQNEPSLPFKGSLWVDSKTGKLSFHDGDGAEYLSRRRIQKTLRAAITTNYAPVTGASYTIPSGGMRVGSRVRVFAYGWIGADEIPTPGIDVGLQIGSEELDPCQIPHASTLNGQGFWVYEANLFLDDDGLEGCSSLILHEASATSGTLDPLTISSVDPVSVNLMCKSVSASMGAWVHNFSLEIS